MKDLSKNKMVWTQLFVPFSGFPSPRIGNFGPGMPMSVRWFDEAGHCFISCEWLKHLGWEILCFVYFVQSYNPLGILMGPTQIEQTLMISSIHSSSECSNRSVKLIHFWQSICNEGERFWRNVTQRCLYRALSHPLFTCLSVTGHSIQWCKANKASVFDEKAVSPKRQRMLYTTLRDPLDREPRITWCFINKVQEEQIQVID